MMKHEDILIKLYSISIFSNVVNDSVIQKYIHFLNQNNTDILLSIKAYSDFVSELYTYETNFSTYVYQRILNDENTYIEAVAHRKEISKTLDDALEQELLIFEQISQITKEELFEEISYQGYLPSFETQFYDFRKDYRKRIQDIHAKGYGMYAKYRAFGVQDNELVPIKHPDPQRLSELVGYELERDKVIKNTVAFLHDMPANNVLLYGDAGTGKSSTIKAILNEYASDGLRLIEVKKHQMNVMPDIIEQLSTNPLKFIIFIDDLSFASNDDNFIAMKNILEGGINHTKSNVLVYATSNRRHFIKEDAKQRQGSELFVSDTIQETMSLAARFGLTITFQKPKKDLYVQIVEELAQRYHLELSGEELVKKAEAFAIRNSGRSPRTARQFVETQKIEETIK